MKYLIVVFLCLTRLKPTQPLKCPFFANNFDKLENNNRHNYANLVVARPREFLEPLLFTVHLSTLQHIESERLRFMYFNAFKT